MKVKPGYKRTEVGVIPENWYLLTIQELLNKGYIIDHLDGNHGALYPRSEEFKDYGVPYVSANDFSDGLVDLKNCKFLSEQRAKLFKKGVAKDGDVLFAHNATVGPVALLETNLNFVILSTTATYFRCDQKHLYNRFLLYVLQAPFFVKQYQAVMAQSTRFQVPITTQRKFSLILPPFLEQRAIAAALSDVDALIAALERLIAKKRAIKHGAMQQLLTGQTRLPGFNGAWKMLKVADSSTLKARIGWQGLTTAEYLETGEYYLVTGTDFVNGRIDWKRCHFVDKERYDQDKNIQLDLDDVLITKDGTIGKVAYIDHLPGKATLNSGVFVIRPKNNDYHSRYLYHVLHSNIFDAFLKQLQAGSTISHLYQKDFVSFEFLAPPLEEQRAIAAVLSDMDAEIAALEARRDKTRALKRGMMQELLTGRIRLV